MFTPVLFSPVEPNLEGFNLLVCHAGWCERSLRPRVWTKQLDWGCLQVNSGAVQYCCKPHLHQSQEACHFTRSFLLRWLKKLASHQNIFLEMHVSLNCLILAVWADVYMFANVCWYALQIKMKTTWQCSMIDRRKCVGCCFFTCLTVGPITEQHFHAHDFCIVHLGFTFVTSNWTSYKIK